MSRCAVLAGALVVAALRAASAQVPEVPVTAVSEFGSVQPGGAFRIALRLDVPDGWYIDWLNPGTTGLPTTLAWTAPAGFSAGPVQWPFPERHVSGADVAHILRGTVYVLTPFTVAASARAGTARLQGELTWLLCSTACIRQQRAVTVPVRIVPGAAGRQAAAPSPAARSPAWSQVEAALGNFPLSGQGITLRAVPTTAVAPADSVRLEVGGLRGAPPAGTLVTFFPAAAGRAAVVVPIHRAGGGVQVTLPATFVAGAPPGRLVGVLVGLMVAGPTHTSRAIAVGVPVAGR